MKHFSDEPWAPFLGAVPLAGDACRFRVWAPNATRVDAHLLAGPAPRAEKAGKLDRYIPLERQDRGYFSGVIPEVPLGTRYAYRLDGRTAEPADPASRYQPEGAHGPSEVCAWPCALRDGRSAEWPRWHARDLVIYELHVGTFTPEGTFAGVVARLGDLVSLGVNAIELMPVAQPSGARGWGYDGVFPFATQRAYGRPEDLAALVQACHRRGVAVILDVVYNHLGPEGDRLPEYGPYFRSDYPTPWGAAINFDGPGSDEVRRYFIENALYWLFGCGFDGLRLDAVHGIVDRSAVPFVAQLAAEIRAAFSGGERDVFLFLENDANDTRYLLPPEKGGYGLTAQWNDDFHHAFHSLVTGEDSGYYQDYAGVDHLAAALADGFVYGDRYSRFRDRHQGSDSRGLAADSFVVFSQNHDQVGNRPFGDRLSSLVDFESLKLAAAAVLLAPGIPLLFMGEEYAEERPFLFFADYSDPELRNAVRNDRRHEIEAALGRSASRSPDPLAEETFRASTLSWKFENGRPAALRAFYARLIHFRKEHLVRESSTRPAVHADPVRDVVTLRFLPPPEEILCVFHFGLEEAAVPVSLGPGEWCTVLDSASHEWRGPGASVPDRLSVPEGEGQLLTLSPRSVVVLSRCGEEGL